MEEQWKQIVLDDVYYNYEVSIDGKVRNRRNGHILKPHIDTDGYELVVISSCLTKKRKTVRVHRMVGIMFIPNPNNLPEINHKDENKSNNHVDNLEWCSSKYNANYGTRNIRTVQNRKEKYGKEHHRAKQVRCINTGQVFDTVTQAEKWCGLWSGAVSACALGHKKTAGNHPITGEPLEWEYVDGSENVE